MDSAIQRLHNRGQAFSQKLCYHMGSWLSLLRLERKQKNYSSISNSHISLSFLLIWNWNDRYVHTLRSSLENHTRFQTKMGKVYTLFQIKTAQKHYPILGWGGTYLYGLYKRTPPPPPRACCTETLPVITWQQRNVKVFFCLSLHTIKSLHNLKRGLRWLHRPCRKVRKIHNN